MVFHRETDFSQTPIGNIPKDWKVVKLGDIAKINKESCDPSREFPEDKFLYVDIESIEGGSGRIKEAKKMLGKDAPSRARRVIHKDDVLMSTVRPYLKAFTIVPNEYENEICSTGFAVLTSKEDINPRYLLYSLFSDTVVNQCNRMMVGGQYPALNSSQVSEIQLPIPLMSEQRGIVAVLGVVDSAIELADKVIAKTERLKKGLMQQLLTHGIGHTEYKDTPIGKIPQDWNIIRLGDLILKLKRGPSKQTNNMDNGVVYLTSDYITDDGFLKFENLKYLDENLVDDVGKYLIERNDLIVNCVNSFDKIGKVAVFEGFSKGVAIGFNNFALTLGKNVNPFFLKYILSQDRYKAVFQSIGKAAVQQVSFSSKDLFRVQVPVPPTALEQSKIVEILSAADNKIKIGKSEKVKLERIKQGMMDLLLTGKVRIKVD